MPFRARSHSLLLLLACLLSALFPGANWGNELRRNMPFLRPLLMGDATVAVGSDSSALFYNPAGLARLAENSIEAFSFQITADDDLTRYLLEGEDVTSQYANTTAADFNQLVGTTLFLEASLRMPIFVNAERGFALGLAVDGLSDQEVVIDNGLEALDIETFLDQIALISFFGQASENLYLGVTLKLINRAGIDKIIDAATLYANGSFDLESDADYQEFREGKNYTRPGVDLGMIYRFPFAPNWEPRMGIAFLNVGKYHEDRGWLGIEFGEIRTVGDPPIGGELPLNVTVGFALSPTFHNIRYTAAIDMVDVGKSALDGDSRNTRTRLGFEVGVGPNPDGTALFSLLFGWNATHFGFGILSRVGFFEIGLGNYTIERGEDPGERPEFRRILLIGIRI